jgi:hypothetical protein
MMKQWGMLVHYTDHKLRSLASLIFYIRNSNHSLSCNCKISYRAVLLVLVVIMLLSVPGCHFAISTPIPGLLNYSLTKFGFGTRHDWAAALVGGRDDNCIGLLSLVDLMNCVYRKLSILCSDFGALYIAKKIRTLFSKMFLEDSFLVEILELIDPNWNVFQTF